MSTSTIPIVKLSSTAELLAFLPVLAGAPVRNRLVIAPFVGNQASRALRIGTERSPSPDTARLLATAALGTLSRLDDCTSVSVAIYRDEPFGEVGPQWYDAFGLVLERLHQSGYHIKDAAIVAGDGWMQYFEGNLATPRSLSEIEAHTKQIPDEARIDPAVTLPEPDPRLARRVTEFVLARRFDQSERDSFGRLRQVAPPDPVEFLETALERDQVQTPARTLARLIAQIDSTNQQNAVKSAEASLANMQAQLLSKQADLKSAQAALDRAEKLSPQKLISDADLMTAQSTLAAAKAAYAKANAGAPSETLSPDAAAA